MEVRAGFIPTPALPTDDQWWRKCIKTFWTSPPAAGYDSDLRAVWRWGAKVTGGPPLFLTSAAHMEDIPKVKRQGLISRAEVWHTPVIIEQRSAGKEKQSHSHYACLHKHTSRPEGQNHINRSLGDFLCQFSGSHECTFFCMSCGFSFAECTHFSHHR